MPYQSPISPGISWYDRPTTARNIRRSMARGRPMS